MSAGVKQDAFVLDEMPQDVLEEIFAYLDYAQVSELGRECKSFREAARSILYRAISKILARIECEVNKIEENSKSQLESPRDSTVSIEQIHFATLMTILKMCSSELRIIEACCGRYMRDREFDFCFPAGDLLDDFDSVVKTVRCQMGEPDERVDKDITTSLFIKTGRFLDFFDATLEMVVAREVPIGVTFLDILGCSQASDFLVELSHSEERIGHQVTGRYELRDTGTMDQPPDIGDYSEAVQAKVLVRYLRNYVRWNNLFSSLDHLWDLEKKNSDENNNNISEKSDVPTHVIDELTNKCTGLTRKRISDTDDICRDIFQASNSKLDSPLGVTVEFLLCSSDLPMSMEALKGGHVKVKDSLTMSEKDSKDACIQTMLSYVEVEAGKESADLPVDVDPDKVLDYVQNVKEHLTQVRGVVDQLAVPQSRPTSSDFDSDRYFSSCDSLRDGKKMGPIYRPTTANSTLSFPYQCSAASIDGNYNAPLQFDYGVGKFRHYNPSHVSVVYHCSLQSLPRGTQCDPHFILSSRSEGNNRGSKKSRSASKLVSSSENSVVKKITRPSTVHGLVDNCKLLEKLSERCISLANSIDTDETLSVEEDADKVLTEGEEISLEEEKESKDVEAKKVPVLVGSTLESKSFLRRQEVLQEFVDGEKFLMLMKIHYMSGEQEICEKIVKVNCTGSDTVIKCT